MHATVLQESHAARNLIDVLSDTIARRDEAFALLSGIVSRIHKSEGVLPLMTSFETKDDVDFFLRSVDKITEEREEYLEALKEKQKAYIEAANKAPTPPIVPKVKGTLAALDAPDDAADSPTMQADPEPAPVPSAVVGVLRASPPPEVSHTFLLVYFLFLICHFP